VGWPLGRHLGSFRLCTVAEVSYVSRAGDGMVRLRHLCDCILLVHSYLSSPEKNTAYTGVSVVKPSNTFWAA
jgi:hypothetical protein